MNLEGKNKRRMRMINNFDSLIDNIDQLIEISNAENDLFAATQDK